MQSLNRSESSATDQDQEKTFPNSSSYHPADRSLPIENKRSIIENSSRIKEELEKFRQDETKSIFLILIDGRLNHQRIHIPYVRYLIDREESKFFMILIHSTGQENHDHTHFPSIFSREWDYWYVDSSSPGSAFHLKKILETMSVGNSISDSKDRTKDSTFSLNFLFDESLEDFCSRLEITGNRPSETIFENRQVYEFYLLQTSVRERVQVLKTIFHQVHQLQQLIIQQYHEHQSTEEQSRDRIIEKIRLMAKETLTGKSLSSVVDSLESTIRQSFTHFVSYVLKHMIDDYGLDTLNKLSDEKSEFSKLFELIDYSTFIQNTTNTNLSMKSLTIRLNLRYSFVPETPLFSLLHQRIIDVANQVKLNFNQNANAQQSTEQELPVHYYDVPQPTTSRQDPTPAENKSQSFQEQLKNSLCNDRILMRIISPSILHSYMVDLLKSFYSIVENNFHRDPVRSERTIDFICRWLMIVDREEEKSFMSTVNKDIWHLAQILTIFEYEQQDLLSLYCACQIHEKLNSADAFNNEQNDRATSRSEILKELFRSMFHRLWVKLCEMCKNGRNSKEWIESFAFISKYYPSEKVLEAMQFFDMKLKVEFMNFAYLILLNQETRDPVGLIKLIMTETNIGDPNLDSIEINSCLQLLPMMIQLINSYFVNTGASMDTLMIDIQQWIISMLKSTRRSSKVQISSLLDFLKQSTCHLSLAMKQFLFDALISVMIQTNQQSRWIDLREVENFWDLIKFLPLMIERSADETLIEYQLPFHPAAIKDPHKKYPLVDLLFFHLRRLTNESPISVRLINQIFIESMPDINNRQRTVLEHIFEQFKEYFTIQTLALFLCQNDPNQADQNLFDRLLTAIIKRYLSIDPAATELSKQVQQFTSIIIKKQSWKYFTNLLKSQRFQNSNSEWANRLHDMLQSVDALQQTKSLQLCHRLHFSLLSDSTLSILPDLHQPFAELSELINRCVTGNDPTGRWAPLQNWLTSKVNENPANNNRIKAILVLIIYYDYYCRNRLTLLDQIFNVIERCLTFSIERCVFLLLLDPKNNMIGYRQNNGLERNRLNELFDLEYADDDDEISIRHILVNLLAMILLSGEKNFLWTFAFQPLALSSTFGFGSTHHEPILANGVHYDCGCVIMETGELFVLPTGRGSGTPLAVPAVYVAYMATFGAMAWHLLLFNESTNNLYGPILAKHAVDDKSNFGRMAGESVRSKVCHFVRARLMSVYHFLSIQFGQDDACILFNRCFEKFAQLALQPTENPWIQPSYKEFDKKFQAEREFQEKIFYPTNQMLTAHKKIVLQVNTQTQIQSFLHQYISQMPLVIDLIHFKTELSSPSASQLPLSILKRFLTSFESFKMTRWIYHLTRFYILLHRTFNQLIKEEELLTLTLEELFERACQSLTRENHETKRKYRTIIEHGIEAVNKYHDFADGLIQPGACDRTQHFQKISYDTSVNYLIDVGVEDEGNIVMLILNVLVAFHNTYIQLLRSQVAVDGDPLGLGPLKDVILDLSSREVSILQLENDNVGVITLNSNDIQWIEGLARATLNDADQYFLQSDSSLKFQFLYLQSHLIRTYLLFCPINHQHIKGKYQFFVKIDLQRHPELLNGPSATTLANVDHQGWNHLRFKKFDELQREFELIERVRTIMKSIPHDYSGISFLEFKKSFINDLSVNQGDDNYGPIDFPLSQINDVRQVYQQTMNRVQHAYSNLTTMLDVPLSPDLERNLENILSDTFLNSDVTNEKDTIHEHIRTLIDFLSDLRDLENTFSDRTQDSLADICNYCYIDNPIVTLLPNQLQCQHYIPLCMKLIETRSELQDKLINIQDQVENEFTLYEQTNDEPTPQPAANFNNLRNSNVSSKQNINNPITEKHSMTVEKNDKDPTIFMRSFSIDDDNVPTMETVGDSFSKQSENENIVPDGHEEENSSDLTDNSESDESNEQTVQCLFIVEFESVHLTQSRLFDQVRRSIASRNPAAAGNPRPILNHPDGRKDGFIANASTILSKLKTRFEKENYRTDSFSIVDSECLIVNFNDPSAHPSIPVSNEYKVVENSSLIIVKIHVGTKISQYSATRQAVISSILTRFIIQQNSEINSNQLFSIFDSFGCHIAEDVSLGSLMNSDQDRSVDIRIIFDDEMKSRFYRIFYRDENENQSEQVEVGLFHPKTTWKGFQSKMKLNINNPSMTTNDFYFWNFKKNYLMNNDEEIDSLLKNDPTLTMGVLNSNDLIDVILSYDRYSTTIRIPKQRPINDLLNFEIYLNRINLSVSSSSDRILLQIDRNGGTNIIQKNQLKHSIGRFLQTNSENLQFQICLLIELIYDTAKTRDFVSISHRNLTIEQFFDMVKLDKNQMLIASSETKMIFPMNFNLSTISQREFFVVERDRQIEVSIVDSSNRSVLVQQFMDDATIGLIYQQNKFDSSKQSLIYEKDFIPSIEFPLKLLNSTGHENKIQFELINVKATVSVTIEHEDDNISSIDFLCDASMTAGRILELVCRFLKSNKKYFRLIVDQLTGLDAEDSVGDLNEDKVQLKLQCCASIILQISFLGRQIKLPSDEYVKASDIIKQVLENCSMPTANIDQFQLSIEDSNGLSTELDLTDSMADLVSTFPDQKSTFQLQMNEISKSH